MEGRPWILLREGEPRRTGLISLLGFLSRLQINGYLLYITLSTAKLVDITCISKQVFGDMQSLVRQVIILAHSHTCSLSQITLMFKHC